jgi:hypothetical protein
MAEMSNPDQFKALDDAYVRRSEFVFKDLLHLDIGQCAECHRPMQYYPREGKEWNR